MTHPDLIAELAGCPFCGAPGTEYEDFHGRLGQLFGVRCDNELCPMSDVISGTFSTKEEAVSAWNARTYPAEIVAMARAAARYRWIKANDNAYLLDEDVIDEAIAAMHDSEREGGES